MQSSFIKLERNPMKSIFFVFAALSVMPFVHAADPYPNRPIKLVVQFPPGGTTDIVVENRAGASGIIGSDDARCRSMSRKTSPQ